MADKMNIVTDGKWQRKKIGTATLDDQHQWRVEPLGGASKTYAMEDLQSAQWAPNGWADKALRNPMATFIGAFLIMLVLNFVGFMMSGRARSWMYMLGFAAVFTLYFALGKVHRAQFRFVDGNHALFSISRGFAKKLRALKPGIGLL